MYAITDFSGSLSEGGLHIRISHQKKVISMLKGIPVELPAMLDAREARARRQAGVHATHPDAVLVSFCLNIPGPVKTNDLLRRLFDEGCAEIVKQLNDLDTVCLSHEEVHAPTGDEALLAVTGAEAAAIKSAMTTLEESHPLGRLFDIDVLAADGVKLSRSTPRRCLLCGRQAQDCARSRRHSVKELTDRISAMLLEYYHVE